MQNGKSLGLKEARKIAEAIIEASENSEGRPMATAVVDRHGDLVCLARMDGATPLNGRMALYKCYTAMDAFRDTIGTRELMDRLKLCSYEFCNPVFTTIPGGVLIKTKDGTVIGAVGTSGRDPLIRMGDEELARIGAKAFEE
jgi:glc operon protein GlcG